MTLSQPAPESVEFVVAGAGVFFPEHLSIQTIDALGGCSVICTNLPAEHLTNLPADLRTKCRSLWHMYIDGRHRLENYNDVVEEVLRAGEAAKKIAWLTPGHPMIFDSVSANLVRKARERGWRVSVLPAISSLDTILSELEYDPASGLFIHEATVLVSQKVPIPSNVAAMLLQPSAFNTDVAKLTLESGAPDLAPFRDYLLKFYRGSQRCAFVCSESLYTGPASITWTTIADLTSVPYRDIAGSTLFIPRDRHSES